MTVYVASLPVADQVLMDANPSAYARHAYASWVLVCSLDEPEAARGRVGMFGRFSRLDGPPYWRC